MVIVLLTVRLAVSLKEVHGAQLLVAVTAHEVLWVPGVPQCSDDLANYRLAASCTNSFLLGLNPLLVHVFLQIAQHVIQIRSSTNHLVFK